MCFFPIMFEHDFEHADHWSTYSTGTPGSDRCHHLKRWWDSFLEDDKNSYKNHGGNSETNHPLKNGGTLDLQGVPTLGPVENPPWDQETSFTFTATVRRDSGGGPLKLGLRWTKDQGNLNAPRYRWAMKKPGLVGLYGGIYTTQLYSFFFFFVAQVFFFHFSAEHIFGEKGTKIRGCCFRMLEKNTFSKISIRWTGDLIRFQMGVLLYLKNRFQYLTWWNLLSSGTTILSHCPIVPMYKGVQ